MHERDRNEFAAYCCRSTPAIGWAMWPHTWFWRCRVIKRPHNSGSVECSSCLRDKSEGSAVHEPKKKYMKNQKTLHPSSPDAIWSWEEAENEGKKAQNSVLFGNIDHRKQRIAFMSDVWRRDSHSCFSWRAFPRSCESAVLDHGPLRILKRNKTYWKSFRWPESAKKKKRG